MAPFVQLGRAPVPGSPDELILSRRGDEFSIQISGYVSELMNSRLHFSEDQLAEWGCEGLQGKPGARVLVGGLGMGFTLAAALSALGPDAEVTVAELVPGVVEWNRGDLGECAGRPLNDPRTKLHLGDVGELIRSQVSAYDAVLLDVDNGPDAMTHADNGQLYSLSGLAAAQRALRPGGVLAIWSAEKNARFTRRLREAGYHVEERASRARPGKGARHTIWLARRRA
ncbi:hypothetical protein DKM44_04630 [Deinococcus irradiatisoli]|uniref:Spermidine synthase n=1 Tax=Deinococcus irradiatisoli TaxID=2202254 RepID=A0A2Z3JCC5_9DEIO|nr:MnmC family methyltransferase [Deinococcus irradiatisoli]AWN22605.1 hypothetical protein DKM44_04630 [Deinococcus irradiatisoli]